MSKLLKDKDPRVRLGAERLVLSLLHGRPVADPVDGDTGQDMSRADPAAVAIRLANFVAGALAQGPGANEAPGSPETDEDDPSAVA
ncbi:MAG: hypothetical protein KJ062_14815 [Thermoanaerobaculia bacterium]|nr:hypothetical protein [Thermoanaerobaculia bacterium]